MSQIPYVLDAIAGIHVSKFSCLNSPPKKENYIFSIKENTRFINIKIQIKSDCYTTLGQ